MRTHKVTEVTATATNIVLTVTNPTNIGNMEKFDLICCKPVSSVVTGAPLPVQATLNGVATNILNAYGQPLLSNLVPYGKTCGTFIVGADESYVILKTPCYA